MGDLPGFSKFDATVEINENEQTKKKSSKKSGGFQSMGLSYNVLKGITKRGYKIPTPIQRKAIPLISEGKDVVAMARTGSGKTACFLIPLFEKLKARSAKTGARALILSPTRELALQTLKFIKEIGKFVGLKSSVILGGDSMDDQFSAIHGNPDVIVATPGRFLHICIEMELKLNKIEYVVFDEADRLFEMGLGEQLTEIIHRLPDSRQTLLFSATLPKVLVEFAKLGLNDPVLLRLDVETKLPEQLQLWYILVRGEERIAALLVLLKSHIHAGEQTIVFAATKHHVEYLHLILDHMGISNTYIYSDLDPAARKINAAKFSTGKVQVLIVTDIAARGIDIPLLDNVINFNFPTKAKLFVHRVGRCARAGRSGTAYSLVTPDEYPYLLDLHLFLGQSLPLVTSANKDGTVGRIPQTMLEPIQGTLVTIHETSVDLVSVRNVSENAYQRYVKTRPVASIDSNKRSKEINFQSCGIHPLFKSKTDESEEKKEDLLLQMKNYRPPGTVFEICGKNKSQEYQIMKEKRALHKEKISAFHSKLNTSFPTNTREASDGLPASNSEEINDVFQSVVLPKKRKIDQLYKKTKKAKLKDEHFIPYVPADQHTEDGLAVDNFHKEASKVQLELTGDSEKTMRSARQLKKWDRKKKKMVDVPDARTGKIKTESGVWIPATYKSNRYAEWKEKTKVTQAEEDNDDDDDGHNANNKAFLNSRPNTHWSRHNEKLKVKQRKSELKSTDQILKARLMAEKKKKKQKKKSGKRKFKK